MGLRKAWVVENADSNDILMNDASSSRNTSSLTSSTLTGSGRGAISNVTSNDKLCRTSSASGSTDGYILSASGDLASEGVYDWPRLSVASQAHLLKRRGMKKAGRRMNLVALNLMKADNKKLSDLKSGRAGPGLRRTGSYGRL